MEYNTVRNFLVIPEYGRNIQKMVEYALSVEDREKRTKIANMIVNVMYQLTPGVKDTADARHKLWDHVYFISDLKLDVDSPFPPPAREEQFIKTERVHYPHKDIKYLHYGNNIQLLIEKALSYDDGPQKDSLVKSIANHMKKLYLTWNRESVEDDVIYQSLSEISGGRLKINEGIKLNETRDILIVKNTKKKKFNPKNHYKNKNKREYNNNNNNR